VQPGAVSRSYPEAGRGLRRAPSATCSRRAGHAEPAEVASRASAVSRPGAAGVARSPVGPA